MKYFLILFFMASTLLGVENFLVNFINNLDKSYKINKNKITLDYLPENVDNNIKYLVIPNLQKYVNYNTSLFSNVEQNKIIYLDSILNQNSKFDIFLFGVNMTLYNLQKISKKSVEALSTMHALQASQLYVLQEILSNSKNLKQLEFTVKHLDEFFTVSFDSNDSVSCQILKSYKHDSSLFRFMILSKKEYTESKYDESSLKIFDGLLISKEDRHKHTIKNIEKKTLEIYNKENSILLKNIIAEYDDLNFLSEYILSINKRKVEFKDLEKTYSENNMYDLSKLEILYGNIFANRLILHSLRIFQRSLEMHNKFKKKQNECKKYIKDMAQHHQK